MTVLSDYVSGTISLTTGSVDFTGSATGWLLASFKEGDTIIDITGATEFMGVIAEITSNTAGTLTKAWEGPSLVDAPYRMRYQSDGSRTSAQARNLIELLGDGTLTSLAGLSGPGVIELLPGGGAQVVPKTDLTSGAAYDIQVANLAARAVYDGQAAGFAVLVANVGDGRSAIYSKASNTSGDWTDPAYVTGPIGQTPEVTIGTVMTGAPGTDAEVTATPTVDGVELGFTIPSGEGFVFRGAYNGATNYVQGDVATQAGSAWILIAETSTGNSPPTLPTESNAYWELMAQKGVDGAGTGDVVGPVGATNNRIAVYDGATGKLLKDGGKTIDELVPGDNSVTNAILANMATATLKGRSTAGTGDPEDLTAAQAMALLMAGGQIPFPATQIPFGNANTLDDYEEGTFTPSYTAGGVSTGVSYGTRTGSYTKVGRLVYFVMRVTLTSAGSASGTVAFTGLPFVSATDVPVIIGYYNNFVGLTGVPLGFISSGGTSASLRQSGATGVATITQSNINNTADILISGCYEVTV